MAITIKGIDRVLKHFDNISNLELDEAVNKATSLVHGQAKSLAPVNTGNLKGSIHMKVTKSGKRITGKVYTNLSYAMYVEFGTGSKGTGTYPYKLDRVTLSYRNTPWVYTPDGGETFYRTNGQVAKPYMYPALNIHKKRIEKMLNDAVKDKLK